MAEGQVRQERKGALDEMSDLDIFGPLVVGTATEEAVQATLERWMLTYLGRLDRAIGKTPPWLKPPRSYTITSDWDHFPEEAVPAVLIMCSGVEKPLMDGKREYRAIFPVKVGIFVESQDRASTDRLAKYYGAALRELLLHKGSLGNFATATTWEGERYGTRVSDRSQRTFGTAEVELNVEVRRVVKRLSGPAEPLAKPGEAPPSPPTVTKETRVKLSPEPL